MSNKLGHSMDNGNKLKWIIRAHGNWKKSKFWGPFWSYQLDSTANSAYSTQKWAKWAELAVLFSWQLQNGHQNFDFFNSYGCRLFIWAYFYSSLSAPIFHAKQINPMQGDFWSVPTVVQIFEWEIWNSNL
jgi:hypothetical protein